MNTEFLIQFAASAAAVGGLVLLVAWARIARPTPPLDEARARALIAEEFPGRALEGVWVSSDGAGALARSGAAALIICRVGDGYAGRSVPWALALASSFRDGRLKVELGEAAAPRAVLALEAWPPKDLGASGLAAKDRAA
ncbi:MAG: hypothetical protein ACK4YQ_08865 [Phenylobacterium sp.]|uniref:hypothetical protein n=1 Tax=Phenylobacterium sp. TaxID=1871053 RepID=UPI00391B04DE